MVAATGIFLEGKLALQGCTRSRRMRSCEVGTSATIVTGEGQDSACTPCPRGGAKSMSEQEGDRLSLEELAQRLEALRRENEQRRSEFEGRMSRRAFLSRAGVAAVGAVAAGTLLDRREAKAAQAADLERFYAGIKSDTQVEHEFGGMEAGILTPEEFRAEQPAEPSSAATQNDLLDVVFGIDVSHWQGEINWYAI